MAGTTAAKARGKRKRGTEDERSHTSKRRMNRAYASPELNDASLTNVEVSKLRPYRRTRSINEETSYLEKMPTEILQYIFELSTNLELPAVCLTISRQLNSNHMYHRMTSSILRPFSPVKPEVLCWKHNPDDLPRFRDNGLWEKPENYRELQATATRLFESKFFTWSFMEQWTERQLQQPALRRTDSCYPRVTGTKAHVRCLLDWSVVQMHYLGPLPKKLLRPPFTEEKINMLYLLGNFVDNYLQNLSIHLVHEALEAATKEANINLIKFFGSLGVRPSTILVRKTVYDWNCDLEVVRALFEVGRSQLRGDTLCMCVGCYSEFDTSPRDPLLWAWADQAEAAKDHRGNMLKSILREFIKIYGMAGSAFRCNFEDICFNLQLRATQMTAWHDS